MRPSRKRGRIRYTQKNMSKKGEKKLIWGFLEAISISELVKWRDGGGREEEHARKERQTGEKREGRMFTLMSPVYAVEQICELNSRKMKEGLKKMTFLLGRLEDQSKEAGEKEGKRNDKQDATKSNKLKCRKHIWAK